MGAENDKYLYVFYKDRYLKLLINYGYVFYVIIGIKNKSCHFLFFLVILILIIYGIITFKKSADST